MPLGHETRNKCIRGFDCRFDVELEVCYRCDPEHQSIINDRGFLKCTRCGGYEIEKDLELCKVCNASAIRIINIAVKTFLILMAIGLVASMLDSFKGL